MVEVLEREGSRTEVLAEFDELAVFAFDRRGGSSGASPHFHATHVDAFVVLEGEVELLTARDPVTLRPGDTAAVPPGVVHGFDNLAPGPVRLLNVHAPSCGFVEYLRRQYAREPADPREFDQHPPEEARGGDPVVARAGEGERFDRGNIVVTIRIDLPQLSLLELDFDATFEVSPHVHDDHVDSFYVTEGAVEFLHGDATIVGRPGDFVAVPPGTRHGFRPANGEPARLLNFHAPETGFVQRVRDQ